MSNKMLRDLRTYLQVLKPQVKDTNSIRSLFRRLNIEAQYKQQTNVECSWTPPLGDRIKVNTDAALSSNGLGHGGVMRDEIGRVLAGFTGSGGLHSVIFQELKAIEVSVSRCIEEGYKEVEVESDSMRAINAINKREKPPWYCRDVLAAIELKKQEFNFISFSHVFREVNRAADYLAGLDQSSNFHTLHFVPPIDRVLQTIVNEDVRGKIYVRRV